MNEKMTLAEQRKITIAAARSCLRSLGVDPAEARMRDFYSVLDDLANQGGTIAGNYWLYASENQVELLGREFRRWQREQVAR